MSLYRHMSSYFYWYLGHHPFQCLQDQPWKELGRCGWPHKLNCYIQVHIFLLLCLHDYVDNRLWRHHSTLYTRDCGDCDDRNCGSCQLWLFAQWNGTYPLEDERAKWIIITWSADYQQNVEVLQSIKVLTKQGKGLSFQQPSKGRRTEGLRWKKSIAKVKWVTASR